MNERHIVIGTAGHIDHGKSALIKALTGIDPDRLKEEKERGMTTDLGFVFYRDDVTIIDVPGHEKFIRHMVAGASTIDFVIFIIAADDGIMPQTVEHFEILKLLWIKNGIVVITKIDMVKKEKVEALSTEIKKFLQNSFLEDATIVPVSSLSMEGIPELKKILNQLISQTNSKKDKGIFRLPIDRCFIMKGFGTVVAGTVLSGTVKTADTLELLPQKIKIKVRSIEVHNKKVPQVGTGFRAALNIAGIGKERTKRGDVLAQPGFYEPSNYLNASLYLLPSARKSLKNLTRLRIHLGTKEILGRVVLLDKKVLEPGDKAMAQFRLETPAVSDINDRYVIRTYSPQTTIGGGIIIEPKAIRSKGFDEKLIEHLQRLETVEPIVIVEENLLTNLELPRKIDEIAYDVSLSISEVKNLIKELIASGKVICIAEQRGLYYHSANFKKLKGKIINILKEYHKKYPINVGIPQLELLKDINKEIDKSLFNYALEIMIQEKSIKITPDNKLSLFDFKVTLDKDMSAIAAKIEKLFLDAGYKPPDYNTILNQKFGTEELVKKTYYYMHDIGLLVNVGESVTFHQKLVTRAKDSLIEFLKTKGEIRVSQFRDLLGASRKYALPLLIYFDTHNVTIKRGDVRILAEKYR